jgi:uncharacterized coiled-coil protein SlyX
MAVSDGQLPPPFYGRSDCNAADWLSEVQRYCTFKNFNADRSCQLMKYLLRQSAADWLEAQTEDQVDTLDHFIVAFRGRFGPSELTKYKSAQDLFSRKQGVRESAEDFVAAIKKIGRRIEADEALLRYAVINGLRSTVAAHVIQQQPETLAEVLQAARVAELIAPAESSQSFQLDTMQLELKRLADKLDQCTAAPVYDPRVQTPPPSAIRRPVPPPRGRSPRRVSFQPPLQHNQQQQQYQQRPQYQSGPATPSCTRCGHIHRFTNYCPAQDPRNTCRYCGKPGHFQSQCYAAKRDQQRVNY